MVAEKTLIRHTSNVKDEVGLEKIEEKNMQFLTEKIISEIKQMPIYPRDRVALAAKNDDVIFVEQVPLHPRDMLNKKTKILKHPRDRLKGKELQVTRYNVSAIVEKTFGFLPEKSLTKIVLFDVSKVNKEKIIDKIIEILPADND